MNKVFGYNYALNKLKFNYTRLHFSVYLFFNLNQPDKFDKLFFRKITIY